MSEQQNQQTTTTMQATAMSACPHPEAVGKRYGDSISEERQAELHGYLNRWEKERDHGGRRGPFQDVELTGADVYWLANRVRKGWSFVPGLYLQSAILNETHLENADLRTAHLEGAYLGSAHLEHSFLRGARLEDADLYEAKLNGANLSSTHLENANLFLADLTQTDLRGAYFNLTTNLEATQFARYGVYTLPALADVRWQNANLSIIDWRNLSVLADELAAREEEKKPLLWQPKDTPKWQRREAKSMRRIGIQQEWQAAARAYRQLASAMREQGMNDEADRFAYRGNVCQRQLHRVQGKRLRQFGSWLIDLVAGYGYRPLRSVVAYILIIGFFSGAYLLNG